MAARSDQIRITAMVQHSATLSHGIRARYAAGCRCMLCRAANSRYETERFARRRAGESNELVSSNEVKRHLLALRKAGVGYKSAGDAAGVSKTTLADILSGRQTLIRRQSAIRLLAVDRDAVAGGTLISAVPTWRILDRLIAEGYTKRQLAQWMGFAAAIQFHRDKITARNAAKVERMERLLAAGKLRRDR